MMTMCVPFLIKVPVPEIAPCRITRVSSVLIPSKVRSASSLIGAFTVTIARFWLFM